MTESSEERQKSEPPAAPRSGVLIEEKCAKAASSASRMKSAEPLSTVRAARTGIRQPLDAARPVHRLCALIPVYDQPEKLADIVHALRKLGLPVIVVDDGSHEPTKGLCDQLAAPQIKVIHHSANLGKGSAVMTGFKAAARLGYTHVLEVDANGRFDLSSVAQFMRLSQKFPHSLICGSPKPTLGTKTERPFGRKLTNFFCALNALSISFADATCGLRIYPLDSTLSVCENARIGHRVEFDPELLVRLLWAGVRVKNIPVATVERTGESHFAPMRDNLHLAGMHGRLFVQMVTRLPILLWSKCFGWAPECERKPLSATDAAVGDNSKGSQAASAKQEGRRFSAVRPQKSPAKRASLDPQEAQRAERARHAAEIAKLNAERTLSQLGPNKRAGNVGAN